MTTTSGNNSYNWLVPTVSSNSTAIVQITPIGADGSYGQADSKGITITTPGCNAPVSVLFSTIPSPPITNQNNLDVSFTDHSTSSDSSHPITAWNWDFGDGTYEFGGGTHTHHYAKPGTYYARLTISNGM